jgi:hypothetical protein
MTLKDKEIVQTKKQTLDVTSGPYRVYRTRYDDSTQCFLEPHLVAIATKEDLEWIASELKKTCQEQPLPHLRLSRPDQDSRQQSFMTAS